MPASAVHLWPVADGGEAGGGALLPEEEDVVAGVGVGEVALQVAALAGRGLVQAVADVVQHAVQEVARVVASTVT